MEMDQDSFMAKLPPNVSSALQAENEKESSPSSEMILRNHEIFLDKGGEGGPKIKSREEILRILSNILARSSGEKERVILKSSKTEIEVLPSWSAKRKTRRFLRRMDRAYHNIEKLGMVEEVQENVIIMAKSPPKEHQIYREEIMIPPPDRIKSIAKLFGGTIGPKMKKKIDPQGGQDNQKENVTPNLIHSTRNLILSTRDLTRSTKDTSKVQKHLQSTKLSLSSGNVVNEKKLVDFERDVGVIVPDLPTSGPESTKNVETVLPESTKNVEIVLPESTRNIERKIEECDDEMFNDLPTSGNESTKNDETVLPESTKDVEIMLPESTRNIGKNIEECDDKVFHEVGSRARDGVARGQGHGGHDGQHDRVGDQSLECVDDQAGECVSVPGIVGAKGGLSFVPVTNIFNRSKPKARTDRSRRTSSTSSRTGSTGSRMTRPGSSGGTASSPTSSALRRTSTLSNGRGAVSKTTSKKKMSTVSFQNVKALVKVYHGLGVLQTNKNSRSQSDSLRCGIGREQLTASQPGLDGMQCSTLIGCAEDGKADRGGGPAGRDRNCL